MEMSVTSVTAASVL